jgi:hypothetical protein
MRPGCSGRPGIGTGTGTRSNRRAGGEIAASHRGRFRQARWGCQRRRVASCPAGGAAVADEFGCLGAGVSGVTARRTARRHVLGCASGWSGSAAGGRTAAASACRRRVFLRLDRATKPVPVCLPTDAIGLGVLDRRRMTLDADPELEAQVERFLICQPELSTKLVDANLLGQLALRSSLPGRARRRYWPPARLDILAHQRRYREPEREIRARIYRPRHPSRVASCSRGDLRGLMVAGLEADYRRAPGCSRRPAWVLGPVGSGFGGRLGGAGIGRGPLRGTYVSFTAGHGCRWGLRGRLGGAGVRRGPLRGTYVSFTAGHANLSSDAAGQLRSQTLYGSSRHSHPQGS